MRRLAVVRDQADTGAAVQDVGLVEGSLVAYGPQEFGSGDGVAGDDRAGEGGGGEADGVDLECFAPVAADEAAGGVERRECAGAGGADEREGGRTAGACGQVAYADGGVDGVLGHAPVRGEFAADDRDDTVG